MRQMRDLEVKFLVRFDEGVQPARRPRRVECLFISIFEAHYFGRLGSKRCELSRNSFQNDPRFKKVSNDPKAEFGDEVTPARNYFKQVFVMQAIACLSEWSASYSTLTQYFRLI